MSKILQDNDAKAIAIPRVCSENSPAKNVKILVITVPEFPVVFNMTFLCFLHEVDTICLTVLQFNSLPHNPDF